ncbi:MBL fold metallo-hydrolase [Shimazuella kribbensis]|uniref:MBL fold metallo-hydrolase n=1 Tax=Shimazuella kribbensis TaxID=139808 RepID=UPI00048FDAC7|nr:MBL fold metallo-hydrolase [Shimazuella kribbensis]
MLLGVNIKFELFDTGYCQQNQQMVFPSKKRGKMAFHSLVALLHHPAQGWMVFDTGYGKGFWDGTKSFPYRLYRYATPVHFHEEQEISAQLARNGVFPHDIKHIIMSHFHGDHTGGLWKFTESAIITHLDAINSIQNKKGFAAVVKGFLPHNVREIPPTQFRFIQDQRRIQLDERFYPFTDGYDVFEDGSVIAVDLPGHAKGQIGIFFQSLEHGIIFLCADSTWSRESLIKNEKPHRFTHFLMDNVVEFYDSFERVRKVYEMDNGITIIPTHCLQVYKEWAEGRYRECF